jgi:hypothetical protein
LEQAPSATTAHEANAHEANDEQDRGLTSVSDSISIGTDQNGSVTSEAHAALPIAPRRDKEVAVFRGLAGQNRVRFPWAAPIQLRRAARIAPNRTDVPRFPSSWSEEAEGGVVVGKVRLRRVGDLCSSSGEGPFIEP